jgi:hypothetical protein
MDINGRDASGRGDGVSHAVAKCSGVRIEVFHRWLRSSCTGGTSGHSSLAVHLVEVISIQEAAFKWFYDIYFPFGTIFILQKIFYAGPTGCTVEVTALSFIEKFAVLLTHIFLVLLAISDLHCIPPLNQNPLTYITFF